MTTALAKTPVGLSDNGLPIINTLEEQFRYAEMAIQSGLVPDSFKNAQAVMIAWAFGAELGLSRMQSLFNIAVVGNKPTIYGKAVVGVVQSKGVLESLKEWIEGSGDDMTAHCVVRRKGFADEIKNSFSVADAKRAGLWMKKTYSGKDTPWVLYPKDMMKYKARARAFATLFGDVLCGLPIYEDYSEVVEAIKNERIDPPSNPSTVEDPLLKQIGATAIVQDESHKLDSKICVTGENVAAPEENEPPFEASQNVVVEPKCSACGDSGKNSKGKPCVCQKKVERPKVEEKPVETMGQIATEEGRSPKQLDSKPLKNQSNEPKNDPIREVVVVFKDAPIKIGNRHRVIGSDGNSYYTNVPELVERLELNLKKKVKVGYQLYDTRFIIVSILAMEE